MSTRRSGPRGGTGRVARAAARAALVVAGTAAALATGELVVRARPDWLEGPAEGALDLPDDDPAWEHFLGRHGRIWTDDPDFGARPVLGSRIWTEFGTWPNDHDVEKTPGVERLVVLGDSVVRRRHFVDALDERSGGEREWWNAGVEGFGTTQEVRWYERFARPLAPDHVVLAFHPNDFRTTPIIYADEQGRAVMFHPKKPSLRPNRTLLRFSHLYRAYLSMRLGGEDEPAIVAEVRASLARLQDVAREDGARLSVVLLPFFAAPDDVPPWAAKARADALEIFEALGLRAFDPLPALVAAHADGVPLQQRPGDTQHPSPELCARMADFLVAGGLLDP